MHSEKGSLSIEAALVITLTLIVIMASFGLVFTLYADQQLAWAASEVKDHLALSPIGFQGPPQALDVLAKKLLEGVLIDKNLNHLIEVETKFKSDINAIGEYEWHIAYTYKFLSLKKGDQWTVPIFPVVKNDTLRFNSPLVFITNYGEKYHKGTCFHLRKSKYPIEREKAEEKGYGACKNCHKPMAIE